jgi:hypothetical protein
MDITLIDPERHQAFKSGFGLLNWHPASGFPLRAARATHLASGRSFRPAKLEYRCDRIQ